MHTRPTHTSPHPHLEHYTIPSREDGITRAYLTAQLPVPTLVSESELSFFADMLERGSRRYSKDRYDTLLESMGAQVGFDVDGTTITVRIAVLSTHIEELSRILADVLAHPLFDPAEIRKAKKEFLQALREEPDNARAVAYGLFSRALYTEREVGYVPTIAARTRVISKITPARLRAIHGYFLRAPWIVSSAGAPASHKTLGAAFEALHIPTQKTDAAAPQNTTQTPHALITAHVPSKQNIELCIGNRLPISLTHTDFLPFSFGLDVLGKRGGFAGRLMKTVREKEGLTYMIYASIRGATAQSCGHYIISTFFTPKDAPQGLSSTDREIRQIVKGGISESELVRFKELLTNQFRLAHESTSSVLALYHRAFVAGRSLTDIVDYPARIAALSRAEVNKALRTYLIPTQIVTAGAGPVEVLRKKHEPALKQKRPVTQ